MLRQMPLPCYPIGCDAASAVRAGAGGGEMWAVGMSEMDMCDCDAIAEGWLAWPERLH